MNTVQSVRRISIVLLACLASASVLAQAPAGTFEPRIGQAGKDVIWVPTPDAMVDRMLRMAEVRKDDYVVDPGSGDGKIAIAAARNLGARAMGLEYNPDMVELSKRRAREAGVQDKVEFRQADIFTTDFSNATVVTMYLMPNLNLKLRPILMKMKPGTRVTSHSFDMGEWAPDETSSVGNARGYLWVIPANVSGNWKVTARDANASVPQTLTIRQRFQKISGEAAFGNDNASLQNPVVRGDRVSFAVRDAQGRLHQVNGRAAGNRISGTIASPGQRPLNFEAQRSDPAQAIDDAGPNEDGRVVSDFSTSDIPARM